MVVTIPTPTDLKSLLLAARGISEADAHAFLSPEYRLGDPFLFEDMEKAIERIKRAVDTGEQIGIYADYDCDGIPAAVILLDLFKKLGARDRVHVYIPDRHMEGYGLNARGITELQEKGVTLILTVDVGITALAEVADAQSRGIDVIVTDHHGALADLPASYALIHPIKSTYPNTEPCGALVAFHLVRAYVQKHGEAVGIPVGWEKWSLDLAGFATLSDMMPLTGENRIIAGFGLAVMKKTRRVGLQVLFAKNKILMPNLTETDLTFTVAPRLNAASRMDTPMLAFELLATDDLARATALVDKLDMINNQRKTLVAQIVKAADANVAHRELPAIVVVGNPEWRPAVLGLVANKLQEKYQRSFFVWGGAGDGTMKGSCRMMPAHHASLLFQAIPEGILLHSGGHQAAGGFAAESNQIYFLEQALNEAVLRVEYAGAETTTATGIDLPAAAATTRHLATVRAFAPFGMANDEPLFTFAGLTVVSSKMFGKAKEHIEVVVKDMTGSMTAFAFFADDALISKLESGNTVTIIGSLEAGWRGGVRVRIKEVTA